VRATAIIEGIPGMPIAINGCPPANSCATANGNIGTKCTLWQSSDGQDNSGWTTFTIGSANSNLIRQLIDNNGDCGSIPPISIGTCINLQNGQDNAALKHLGDVYSSNGNGFSGVNNSPFPEDCGLIPVVDTVKFNQCSPIVSWARLCLRDVDSHGGGKSITGDLTCNVSNIGKTDTKCYVPKLVRDAQSGM
jgi:hypothetical protein